MSFDLVPAGNKAVAQIEEQKREFLTMVISGQLFGISVYSVRDVLAPQKITSIPLSPREVIGSLNLRGRIVTAVDLRAILNIQSDGDISKSMSVVVDHHGELYSLVVDSVGEVLSLSLSEFAHNPENLSKSWQDLSLGVYPLEGNLLVILDINKTLFNISGNNTN